MSLSGRSSSPTLFSGDSDEEFTVVTRTANKKGPNLPSNTDPNSIISVIVDVKDNAKFRSSVESQGGKIYSEIGTVTARIKAASFDALLENNPHVTSYSMSEKVYPMSQEKTNLTRGPRK